MFEENGDLENEAGESIKFRREVDINKIVIAIYKLSTSQRAKVYNKCT